MSSSKKKTSVRKQRTSYSAKGKKETVEKKHGVGESLTRQKNEHLSKTKRFQSSQHWINQSFEGSIRKKALITCFKSKFALSKRYSIFIWYNINILCSLANVLFVWFVYSHYLPRLTIFQRLAASAILYVLQQDIFYRKVVSKNNNIRKFAWTSLFLTNLIFFTRHVKINRQENFARLSLCVVLIYQGHQRVSFTFSLHEPSACYFQWPSWFD